LVAASAACTARDPLPEARLIDSADQAAQVDERAADPVAAPPAASTPPNSSSQGKEKMARPAPPPAKPAPPPAPRDIKPSPWQPPAIVDPAPPEVGNETPG
jgi:hypothetical protein